MVYNPMWNWNAIRRFGFKIQIIENLMFKI